MSETTNLKLFKHDNPATNTDEFDIAKSINENWDKIDTAVGNKVDKVEGKELSTNDYTNADKQKLAGLSNYDDTALQNKVTQLEKEKALLERDLLANQITDTVEGESLALVDCSSARLVDYGIEGNSEQNKREGYNLIDLNVTQSSKVTVNNDGTITINGTGGFSLNFKEITLKANKTYYQRYELVSGTITGSYIFMAFNGSLWLPTNNHLSYTPTEDTKKSTAWINNSAVFENAKIRIWATEGEAKPFEPYGVMPSPDYPSKIKNCGDNINLFDKDNLDILKNIWLLNNNTTGSSTVTDTSNYIDISKYKEVTINFENETNGKRDCCLYDTNKNLLQGFHQKVPPYTIETNGAKYIRFSYNKSANNVKLEPGNKATPYSPYNQGNIDLVKSNKNLINFGADDYNYGIGKSHTEGTTITLTGNQSISANTRNNTKFEIFIPKGTTIMYSIRILSGKENYLSGWIICNLIYYFNDGTSFLENSNRWNSAIEKDNIPIQMKKFDKDIIAIALHLGTSAKKVDNNTSSQIVIGCQLELGDTATEYILHQEQTYTIPTQKPFRAIGDVRDRFIKQDGKWYEEHKIDKIILDETIVPANGGNYTNTYRFDFAILSNSKKVDINKIMCYRFVSSFNDNGDYEHCRNGGVDYYNRFIIYVNKSRLGDVSSATNANASIKQWLTENPITIDYILETPELIECTQEQNEILDKLENDENYKGLTYIYSTDEVAPNLKATYSKNPFSGDYDNLSNKPTIPTKTSELSNDSNFQTSTQVTQAINGVVGNIDTILDNINGEVINDVDSE